MELLEALAILATCYFPDAGWVAAMKRCSCILLVVRFCSTVTLIRKSFKVQSEKRYPNFNNPCPSKASEASSLDTWVKDYALILEVFKWIKTIFQTLSDFITVLEPVGALSNQIDIILVWEFQSLCFPGLSYSVHNHHYSCQISCSVCLSCNLDNSRLGTTVTDRL